MEKNEMNVLLWPLDVVFERKKWKELGQNWGGEGKTEKKVQKSRMIFHFATANRYI